MIARMYVEIFQRGSFLKNILIGATGNDKPQTFAFSYGSFGDTIKTNCQTKIKFT